MKAQSYTCDTCNKELNHTNMEEQYRLKLCSERLYNNHSACVAMGIEAEIKNDMHFCHLRCLKKWLDNYMGYDK